MSLLKCVLASLLAASLSLSGATALAQVIPGGVSSSAASAQASDKPSDDLIQTLKTQAATRQQSLADLKKQLEKAPRQIQEAKQALEKLKSAAPKDPMQVYASTSLMDLEQRLAERLEQVSSWQKALTDANTLIITAQTRPERAQAELGNSQARVLEIDAQLSSGREEGKAITPERAAVLNAELATLQSTIELRRQEVSGNSLLLELGKTQRDLLTEQISRAEQETLALQSLISEQRSEQSQQMVAELAVGSSTPQSAADRMLVEARAENLKFSGYLLQATERLNSLTRRNLEARQQLDSLNQTDRLLAEQIAVLDGNQLLSRILYQQQKALPKVIVDKDLAGEIADLRLYQFELAQNREQMRDPQAYLEQLLAKKPSEALTPESKAALQDLIQARSELLKRLEPTLNNLLNESIALQLHQRQLQELAKSIRGTIEEQMFWIPSNKPLDISWFEALPERLAHQFDGMPMGQLLQQWKAGLLERPLFFLPLVLLILGMLWKRRAITQKLEALSQGVGHYSKDSQLKTPVTLLLSILLALPGALAFALCGYLLQMDGRGQNAGLGAAFFQMAQAWLLFYTAHQILRPKGMAELHFRWPVAQISFLRKEVRRLGLVVGLLVSVVAFATHQPTTLPDDVVGFMVVMVCYLLMSLGLFRLLFRSPLAGDISPLYRLLGGCFSLLPGALMVVVGLGYYYTALRLTGRLIDTLYLVMLWIILEATLVRGLSVAARRLAYQRMLAKRKAQAEEAPNSDALELAEDPNRNIEQVNQQSLRLTRLTLFGSFLVALYWVWADLISVVSYLDNFTLYEFGTGASLTAISLKDFLAALLLAGITLVLARNLPGLLEVMVLSRLQLAQGSAYATSTLLSYALMGFGITLTLSTLGVTWDKLQWLVAALSVGLGFGLQEIFANFVSGLIILFERPVRIGDVVTIGSLSGRVSRIRIRATTITDFDRKEIIVPNKTFITSQLINWSLTDTITRVTIKVGVAYGSDLELVRKLMLQAAQNNVRVLRDPSPEVFFLNFGESTLDHELRIHVRELGDRTPSIDEINRVIDHDFNEHGISIAFRQVDVTLKNSHGQELVLSALSATGASTANEPS